MNTSTTYLSFELVIELWNWTENLKQNKFGRACQNKKITFYRKYLSLVFAMIVKPVLTEKEKTAEKSTFGAKIFAVNFLLDLLHGRTNVKYCQSYFKISLSLSLSLYFLINNPQKKCCFCIDDFSRQCYKTFFGGNKEKIYSENTYSPTREVSLYSWPPIWVVWIWPSI